MELYIGKDSGKMHLEVYGVTLATEGDLCRDSYFRKLGVDVWTRIALAEAKERMIVELTGAKYGCQS